MVCPFAEWVSISLRSSDCSIENSSPWISSMRREGLTWILYSPFSYTVIEMEGFLSLLATFSLRCMAIQFLPRNFLKDYCTRFYLILQYKFRIFQFMIIKVMMSVWHNLILMGACIILVTTYFFLNSQSLSKYLKTCSEIRFSGMGFWYLPFFLGWNRI